MFEFFEWGWPHWTLHFWPMLMFTVFLHLELCLVVTFHFGVSWILPKTIIVFLQRITCFSLKQPSLEIRLDGVFILWKAKEFWKTLSPPWDSQESCMWLYLSNKSLAPETCILSRVTRGSVTWLEFFYPRHSARQNGEEVSDTKNFWSHLVFEGLLSDFPSFLGTGELSHMHSVNASLLILVRNVFMFITKQC